jgi:hypothetical protein
MAEEYLRYLYRTHLRKYRIFRGMRNALKVSAVDVTVVLILSIPCALFLLFAIPYLNWKQKKECEEENPRRAIRGKS